ncbi:hypothetical protein [Caloramator proteoclasticus]|uniref:Helix-turn-helix domain-containing protein n=1 Tax=Caloramator proteoclasticus DSM 10124 TaxID=1121262 RepID=A0A1M4X7W2_9CLOT|nr:hypothetical protein [Caloramator proteoclasticus]SHE89569.1 hypothetical protein SAMN02746091_01338 [Caloramator proteoclasticus DSM 10124]
MLNEELKEKILELRKKGYGYTSIASVLKVKKDDVRNLCKRYGLDGYWYSLNADSIKIVEKVKTCRNCDKQIIDNNSKGRKRIFCSKNCRLEFYNKIYLRKKGF